MIKFRPDVPESDPDRIRDIEDYPEPIPDGLRPFYTYLPEKGHCIRIIPSILEEQAAKQGPGQISIPCSGQNRAALRDQMGAGISGGADLFHSRLHGLRLPPDDTEY